MFNLFIESDASDYFINSYYDVAGGSEDNPPTDDDALITSYLIASDENSVNLLVSELAENDYDMIFVMFD